MVWYLVKNRENLLLFEFVVLLETENVHMSHISSP